MENSHILQKVGAVVTVLSPSSSCCFSHHLVLASCTRHSQHHGPVWLSSLQPHPEGGQGLTVKLATMWEGGLAIPAYNLFSGCTQDPTQCLRVQLPGNKALP